MKDFSFWEEYEGTSEGSGRSEKIWLINPDTGQTGLFKYKKDENTTDHVSECLAYHLAQLVGIPCAKFELGVYFDREGSMSYNIIKNKDEILIEGISFLNYEYPHYNPEKFIDVKSGAVYSLEMIEKVMSKFINFIDFLKIPIFDYLSGNSDRHQSNWAILVKGIRKTFSPLYDNSSSLCAYLSENQIRGYLGNDKLRWRSLVQTKSKSLIRRTIDEKERPTHLEMMQYIKDKYYDETKDFVKKIVTVMTKENICDILNRYTDVELKRNKKIIIEKFLLDKTNDLKVLYFGKEEENVD
ncbi:HipA domain-containing protein [Anaerosacchariphilus polymeriproducens]|uniref:HipA-like C-terminal domain-containing protein n=1 Tax=Anaerosacchariphilus polymeriproducens TaxID=1812858 RepID=A0A371AR73_9FIRM|nr:HipA domain-containing protein [Anaerosacchariphilus polymeriproducens]RDU22075.1 hypothetical protein DWV06_16215 [Anaerosacchariphilus polymeriproducens]